MRSFQSLYDSSVPPLSTPPESVAALSYKSMELLNRATKLRKLGVLLFMLWGLFFPPYNDYRTCIGPAQQDFVAQYESIEGAIQRLERAFPPLSYSEDADTPLTESMPIHVRMIFPRAMLQSSKINLYTALVGHKEEAYQQALNAAEEIMSILHAIKHYDFNYLEVALAVSLARFRRSAS